MHQATRRVQLHGRRVSLARRGGVEPSEPAAAPPLSVRTVLPGLQQRRT